MNIDAIHEVFLSSTGICTDTRKILKGELFIALKGPNFNANELAKEALEKGAIAAIIDDQNFLDNYEQYILVGDGLKTLQDLANYHRKYLNTPLIGITGSNGKTTTKELVLCVLAKKYKVLATAGNFNNHIGVPLTLLKMAKEHEIGIVEMGANHVGEIAKLCEIAEINYGLITSIGKAHLEGFGSVENIKKTKRAVYDFALANNGKCFVNESLESVKDLFDGKADQLIGYGAKGKFEIQNIYQNEKGIEIHLRNNGNSFKIKSQLFGTYNALNVISALAVGHYFDIGMDEMIDAIAHYSPDNNRSQIKSFRGGKFIMDAYNANPTSMRLAIESLAADKKKNKFLILGDMVELGENAEEEHNKIIELIEKLNLKSVVIGSKFNETKKSKHCAKFIDISDAKTYLDQYDFLDHLVLVKGSRSIALEKLFDDIN